jgi:hypothetical protein
VLLTQYRQADIITGKDFGITGTDAELNTGRITGTTIPRNNTLMSKENKINRYLEGLNLATFSFCLNGVKKEAKPRKTFMYLIINILLK